MPKKVHNDACCESGACTLNCSDSTKRDPVTVLVVFAMALAFIGIGCALMFSLTSLV